MSAPNWRIESSHHALDFISEEYNRLESFKEGLGERFFDKVEATFNRIKSNPFEFELKTAIYRKGLVNISKRLQYAIYFRIHTHQVFVDLILPTSIDPDLHPSD